MKVINSFTKSQAAYAPEYNEEVEVITEAAVSFRRGNTTRCKSGKKSMRPAKKDHTADASFQGWLEETQVEMPVVKTAEVLEVADMIGFHEHFPAAAIAEEPQGVTRGGSEGASSDSAETLSSEIARGGSEGASSDSAGISAEQLNTSTSVNVIVENA